MGVCQMVAVARPINMGGGQSNQGGGSNGPTVTIASGVASCMVVVVLVVFLTLILTIDTRTLYGTPYEIGSGASKITVHYATTTDDLANPGTKIYDREEWIYTIVFAGGLVILVCAIGAFVACCSNGLFGQSMPLCLAAGVGLVSLLAFGYVLAYTIIVLRLTTEYAPVTSMANGRWVPFNKSRALAAPPGSLCMPLPAEPKPTHGTRCVAGCIPSTVIDWDICLRDKYDCASPSWIAFLIVIITTLVFMMGCCCLSFAPILFGLSQRTRRGRAVTQGFARRSQRFSTFVSPNGQYQSVGPNQMVSNPPLLLQQPTGLAENGNVYAFNDVNL